MENLMNLLFAIIAFAAIFGFIWWTRPESARTKVSVHTDDFRETDQLPTTVVAEVSSGEGALVDVCDGSTPKNSADERFRDFVRAVIYSDTIKGNEDKWFMKAKTLIREADSERHRYKKFLDDRIVELKKREGEGDFIGSSIKVAEYNYRNKVVDISANLKLRLENLWDERKSMRSR